MMNERIVGPLFAILIFCTWTVTARPADDVRPGSWSGVIINGTCNADDAFAEAAKCTAEGR